MKQRCWSLICSVFTSLVIWGCAPGTVVYNVPAAGAGRVVAMTASSFEFSPAVINAHQGDRLVLKVTNSAGLDHNLTIKNPEGTMIQSVPLPAGKTVEVELKLIEAGHYRYYCNRPFHSTLGMTGNIESLP
jgi:uncharacterized cupredoxin-like copper-binding protein